MLALAVMLPTPSRAETPAPPPEPQGYRMDAYLAPVPATLEGARVLDADEAHALWKSGKAAFIDVLPRPPKPALPPGTIWREAPHRSIPGAVWLPNTGYGDLAPQTLAYFRAGLEEAAAPGCTLVFFCRTDCWMSWNAARRALELGYGSVAWFPEGIDGWEFESFPTEIIVPRPGE